MPCPLLKCAPPVGGAHFSIVIQLRGVYAVEKRSMYIRVCVYVCVWVCVRVRMG